MNSRTEELITPALRNDLIELVAASFTPPSIDELGRLLFPDYSSHAIAGEDRHITISRRRGARLLVEHADENEKTPELIRLIAELEGGIFDGKHLEVKGIEGFFNSLAKIGIIYDPAKRRLFHSKDDIQKLKNWGSLREGRTYEVSVLSVDIVGNSLLVREYGTRTMEKLNFELWRFLDRKLAEYDGRMWSWAGDGGILAFAFADNVNRAVKCAIDIQSSLPLFNISPENPVSERVTLRIGVDTGKVRFYSDTGRIVSDVINYAAHLEKAGTEPGRISLSQRTRDKTDAKILTIFDDAGDFEGFPYVTTASRLDMLFALQEGCPDTEATA